MKCALVYDFDGTLAEGDCAEHGPFKSLGITSKRDFWTKVKARAKNDDGDEILAYLGELADLAHQMSSSCLSESELKQAGSKIPLFEGVDTWFERINRYASDQGIALQHYIVSSGLDLMIRGTEIGNQFKMIFACKYHYDESGERPIWPAQAINYTTKTQYLFRINKGIHNSWDNEAVNTFIDPAKRDIPFDRMIYFGDGDTDIPAMKMIRYQGG